jgi:hypothetical protein
LAFDFQASILNDYEVFDGLETVEVRLPGSTAWVEVEGVLRRSTRIRDANAATSVGRDTNAIAREGHSGDYTAQDVQMHIPRALFPTAPPLGTAIRDASEIVWVCIDDTKNTLQTRWTPRVRLLTLEERLSSRVSIQMARAGEDSAGTPRPLWIEIHSGVAARITPMRVEPDEGSDLSRQTASVVIILGEEIEFNSIDEYRVVADDGKIYHVDSADTYDRLEFLPQLYAHEATPLFQD